MERPALHLIRAHEVLGRQDNSTTPFMHFDFLNEVLLPHVHM